jgi:hypothetical protein
MDAPGNLDSGQPQLVKFENRAIKTVLPTDTTEFSMRLMDWRRIFSRAKQIPEGSATYANLQFACIGAFVSAGFALISEYQDSTKLAEWVRPTTWAILACSAVLAAVFFVVSKDRDKKLKTSCDALIADMRAIHQCFFPGREVEEDLGDRIVNRTPAPATQISAQGAMATTQPDPSPLQPNTEIDAAEIEILKYLAKSNGKIAPDIYSAIAKIDRVRAKYYFVKLARDGFLIFRTVRGDYVLAHKGREYLVKHNLV